MSRIIPYFDEDSMDKRVIRVLQGRGLEVVTALDVDMIHQKDEAHLAFATRQGYTLCSFNVGDFYQLHSTYLSKGKRHSGIILSQQQQYSVGEYARRLLRLIAEKQAEDMVNWIEFLSAWE